MSQSCASRLVIDLTQALEPGIPLAHVLPPFDAQWVLDQDKGDPVNCMSFHLSEHSGTHMDVPRHVLKSGDSLDAFAPTLLCGPVIRLDVTNRPKGLEIDLALVKQALQREKIDRLKGAVVLLHTNHSLLWQTGPEGQKYLAQRPYVAPETAQYLADQGIRALGVDVGGPDPLGGSLAVHRLLLERKIFIIESLCHLDQVPPRGYLFLGFPLRLKAGTGSPIRALAVAPEFLRDLAGQAF